MGRQRGGGSSRIKRRFLPATGRRVLRLGTSSEAKPMTPPSCHLPHCRPPPMPLLMAPLLEGGREMR